MCEPVSIVAATLTIAVNAFKTGRTTYSLIQGLRDAPNHINQLSSHLSAFNAVLASLHAVIAQEAAKVDHDPLTISQLENLPGLLNTCQEVLIEARTIVEQGLEGHQGLRAMQWQVYRKDDLALITNKLKDYTSTLTLGCSALTIAKSNTAQETTSTILDSLRDIQRKLTQVQGGLACDEPLLRYLADTESVISGSVPPSAVPSRQNTIGRNTGFVYELEDANVTNPGAARTPAPSKVSRRNPLRRLLSSAGNSSQARPRPPPPEDLRARVESIFSQPSEPEQPATVSRTINRSIWNSVEPQQSEPPPPSNERAIRYNPAPLPFVDTLLSQQLAGDDQMLYEMHFRHAPEDWRDPITEFCHSQYLRLQNTSPDVHEVHRKYREYRALVKGSDRESCVWQFLYRGVKIKYDKSPLPMVRQVTLEICNYDMTDVKPVALDHWTYIYVFDESLVLARQWGISAKRTRSCSVIGYLHYQKVKALDMPAYGIKDRYLSIRCHNGTLMADGTMLGDIRLKFNTDEDKLFVKDVIVRWAAAHTPKTISREQVAWDKKLKGLRGRHFVDPVTGNTTTGEEIERYTRRVDEEHSQLTKGSISADELAQLFGELRPKYEALPTSVQREMGSGFVSQTADGRPTQRSVGAGIHPWAADEEVMPTDPGSASFAPPSAGIESEGEK